MSAPTIPVTKPTVPELADVVALLEGIWARRQLTNGGPLVERLERMLAEQLEVRHAIFVANGTIAIQLALRAVAARGAVVTTPFSFVATTSAPVWEGYAPRFADIESEYLTISPAAVEHALTDGANAILATHVYGNPCDVEALESIGRQFSVPVIYDAAHAFGTRFGGKPLPAYGDISTLSFHATKLFHTVEGGAVVTNDDRIASSVRAMRSFGHNSDGVCDRVGINAKNSEVHAAVGLALLPRVREMIAHRAALTARYDARLLGMNKAIARPLVRNGTQSNHAYYPVLLPTTAACEGVVAALGGVGIQARRYFFPSLSTLSYIDRQPCPISEDVAPRILCLPLYQDLTLAEVDRIADVVLSA